MSSVLRETEVDGVRCFWVDTGRPTLNAQLSFRAGLRDGRLAQSGWLHLLEHSALHGRGGGSLQVNGSVGVLSTQFDAHGPADRVAGVMSEIACWLAAPEFEDLERERRVLQAEARLRRGPARASFVWRYGSLGLGMVSNDEPGLGLATASGLSALATEVFVRSNAVLALDGPPPAGLRLALPEGPYRPVPPTGPGEAGSQMYRDESGLVLSGVATVSRAAMCCPPMLQRAIREWLRDREGAAYAPWSMYEQLDAENPLVVAGSDVAASSQDFLLGDVLDLLHRLNADGIPQPWLEELREELLQRMTDPHAAAAPAWRSASRVLLGGQPQDLDAAIEEVKQVDTSAVRDAVLEVCATLLVGVPHKTVRDPRLPEMVFPTSDQPPEGRTFSSVNAPADTSFLTLTADDLAVTSRTGTLSLPIRSAAALYVYPDGQRTLIDKDGWSLSIDPSRWRNGHEAVALLDEAVPPDLHLPQPAPDNPSTFEPAPFLQRWWLHLRREDSFWLLVAIILTPLVYGISVLVAAQAPDPTTQMIIRAAPAWITVFAVAYMYNRYARGRR